MGMPNRFVAIEYMIDANRANAKGLLVAMNQLQKWDEDGVISLVMSDTARDEIARGGSAARLRRVDGQIYTRTVITTDEQFRAKDKIEAILAPAGVQNQNQENDVDIVFQAYHNKLLLITNDGGSRRQPGGMLGNRKRLDEALGIKIITDEEAVDHVRGLIRARDDRAKWWHDHDGLPLPDWVGVD